MRKLIPYVFLSLLFLTGCSKGKSTPTLAPFISDTIPVIKPVGTNFEQVDCASMYNQPADQGNQPGQPPAFDNNNRNDAGSPQCGYLSVPENRSLTDSPTIKIAVTISMTSSTVRRPDPILVIGSGNSFGRGGYLGSPGAFGEMSSNRDVISFSMRGMGRSQPAYTCTQYSDLSDKIATENLSLTQWEQAYINVTQACRTQLESAGVNLSAYNSASIAADLEVLRKALGYSQWNIYASSYGTRIALSLMRDFPETLRSVILDSPWPLQVNTYAEQAVGAEQVLDKLFQYCAEDDQCNKFYPMLKEYFYEDIDALDARPITVHTANLSSGALSDVILDGNKLLDFVLSTLSPTRLDQINEVPRMIYQLHDGKTEDISLLLGQSNGSMQFNGGISQLILCNDESGSSTSGSVASTNPDLDLHLQDYFKTIADANEKACEVWKTVTPASGTTTAVSSNVATLLLTGDLNWRIPASWASLTAQTLSHAYVVQFAGTGQAIASSRDISACSNAVVKSFLTNPGVQPDFKCASKKPNIIWITLP
jgi:pimeloyl-ACP methyl ester carboxylesterase